LDYRRHHPRGWRLEALKAAGETHFGFFAARSLIGT
jgi:hypothetical protein